MLLLLAVLHFAQKSISASPLSLFLRDTGDPITLDSATTPCTCPDQRSVWDILWSCLATIFACSWLSVHPNIPAPKESRKVVMLRRLELMFWSVIAPEMIIMWAMRQWLGARNLARLWRDKGWTKTHGYFIQMGGFMLYRGSTPQGILSPERLKELYDQGQIDFPGITEEQIKDRSKADALAKTIVVGQTTWFVAQCLARGIQGLDLTGLELVTVALAFLNAFTYFLWWNKPLDVETSVPIYFLDSPKERSAEGEAVEIQSVSTTNVPQQDGLRSIFTGISTLILRIRNNVKEEGYGWLLYAIFLLGPSKVVVLMFSRLGDMMDSEHSTSLAGGQMRVATFYALRPAGLGLRQIISVTSGMAVAFGAIHCAGWALTFPTVIEARIWEISSVVITITPLIFGMGSVFGILNEYCPLHREWFDMFGTFVGYSVVFTLPFYVIARLALLVEALIGLRRLTPGELAEVKWTVFIPHI